MSEEMNGSSLDQSEPASHHQLIPSFFSEPFLFHPPDAVPPVEFLHAPHLTTQVSQIWVDTSHSVPNFQHLGSPNSPSPHHVPPFHLDDDDDSTTIVIPVTGAQSQPALPIAPSPIAPSPIAPSPIAPSPIEPFQGNFSQNDHSQNLPSEFESELDGAAIAISAPNHPTPASHLPTDISDSTVDFPAEEVDEPKMGLIGLTANAFAFIAPGAFLWITFQVQAANPGANGAVSSAMDTWVGIFFATIIAIFTALPFSELARKYHHAGYGGPYYFADKAFGRSVWVKWTRFIKFFVAGSLILFYWIYPGIFSAFLTLVIVNVLSQVVGPSTTAGEMIDSYPTLIAVMVAITLLITYIVIRGVHESKTLIYGICILQTLALFLYSTIAILFRWINPFDYQDADWLFSSSISVVLPHSFSDTFSQCAISILLLVGFESATAMAGDAEHASRDIPKAVLFSLLLGAGGFFIEYYATLYAVSNHITFTTQGETLTGFAALAASKTPIGDLLMQMIAGLFTPNVWPGLVRDIYALIIAVSLTGAIVAVMSTTVRLTLAVAQDDELPAILKRTHYKFKTPHIATIALGLVTFIIGTLATFHVSILSVFILASNIGVFFLYGTTCFVCTIAFLYDTDYSYLRHLVIPVLGLCFNLAMFVDMALNMFIGSQKLQYCISFLIAFLWFLAYFIYFYVHTKQRNISFLMSHQSFFRPFQLDDHSCYPEIPQLPIDSARETIEKRDEYEE